MQSFTGKNAIVYGKISITHNPLQSKKPVKPVNGKLDQIQDFPRFQKFPSKVLSKLKTP